MAPKEKAKQLIKDFENKMLSISLHQSANREVAKACALIVCAEVKSQLSAYKDGKINSEYNFWNLVETEIE